MIELDEKEEVCSFYLYNLEGVNVLKYGFLFVSYGSRVLKYFMTTCHKRLL